MPKISDEKRNARRTQILEAAWACFQREGLHATTMDDIISASGLSAGAVYSYYVSKEELIVAAVTSSLEGLGKRFESVLSASPPLAPDVLVQEVARTIVNFTARDGYDLKRIALLGWSETQRNERLRETMRGFYLAFRRRLQEVAEYWKQSGMLRRSSSPRDVSKALLSIILGFVVQAAIVGDVDSKALGKGMRDLAT